MTHTTPITAPLVEVPLTDPAHPANQWYITPPPDCDSPPSRKRPSADREASGAAQEGYVCLGYDGLTNVIWSNPRRCVERLRSDQATLPTMKTLAGTSWILGRYLDKDEKGNSKLNTGRMQDDLIEGCQRAGKFTEVEMMGAGIWKVKLDGQPDLVCNSGDHLFSASGRPVRRIDGRRVFTESRDIGLAPDTPSATDAEVRELMDALTTWNWRNPADAIRVFGWSMYSSFSGAMTTRPHMYITGIAGAGKSTALSIIKRTLGGAGVKTDGIETTSAGIRQSLKHDAVAVLLDELGDSKTHSPAEAARIRSIQNQLLSGYNDDSGALKGTADGQGRHYSSRYTGIMAGIIPPEMQKQDRSRMLFCTLSKLAKGAPRCALLNDLDRAELLGQRIRMRLFREFSKFEQSIQVLKDVLLAKGYDDRDSDTNAPALAAWHVLTTGQILDPVSAGTLADRAGLGNPADLDTGPTNERSCADWLLCYIPKNSALPVGELIEKVRNGMTEYAQPLEMLGLKVSQDDRLHICNASAVQGLRELYAGTTWSNGGWATVFSRIEGATPSVMRFAGKSQRVASVPLAWLFEEVPNCQQLTLD